jgi:hypothetical protein
MPAMSDTVPPFPIPDSALMLGHTKLRIMLDEQRADYGGNEEIAPGCWAVFAVEKTNETHRIVIDALMATATFAYQTGESQDDAWILHYVDSADRATARYWIDDLIRVLDGRARQPNPSDKERIKNLLNSPMPHRIARELADRAATGELPPGAISDRSTVRAILDRSRRQEPVFLAAILTILEAHLIDLKTLFDAIEPEDIALSNSLTQGGLSQDPFMQTRQTAAAGIREFLVINRILNPLNQQKHTDVQNPYVELTELRHDGRDFILRIDGRDHNSLGSHVIETIQKVRRQIYRGITFPQIGTKAPWVTDEKAFPLRFIVERGDARREIAPLLWLYMLERAMES